MCSMNNCLNQINHLSKSCNLGGVLGCAVVKTSPFYCRGCEFNPWSRNESPTCHVVWPRKRKVLQKSESEVAQLCQIRRDPMDRSLPDSSIHGIFQARVVEWVAIAFSCGRLSSQPHEPQPTRFLCPWEFPGKSSSGLPLPLPMAG